MSELCEYAFVKGVLKGQKCGKYAKVKIFDVPYCRDCANKIEKRARRKENSIAIMNQIQGPPRVELNKDRINQSTFFIVINSNKTPEKLGDDGVRKFVNYAKMFEREDVNYHFLVNKEGGEVDKSKVLSFERHADVEVGEKNGLLHANITVEIMHRTWVRYNLDRLRDETKEYLGYNTNVRILTPRSKLNRDADNFVKYSSKVQLSQQQTSTNAEQP